MVTFPVESVSAFTKFLSVTLTNVLAVKLQYLRNGTCELSCIITLPNETMKQGQCLSLLK